MVSFLLKIYLFLSDFFLCVLVFCCVYVCVRVSDFLEPEFRLWAATWVPGIEPRLSGRATSVFNHWAISPTPDSLIFICMGILPTHMLVYHVHAVLVEARRGHWISWDCCLWAIMKLWGAKCRSSRREASVLYLYAEPLCHPLLVFFLFVCFLLLPTLPCWYNLESLERENLHWIIIQIRLTRGHVD